MRASRHQAIRDEALRLVRVVAAEQERIDKATRWLSIAFSATAAIRAGDRGGRNEIAKSARAQIDGYVNIGIADSGGMVLCAGSDGLAGVELRDNSLRGRVAADTALAIGNYQIGRVAGREILIYAIPWRGEAGENTRLHLGRARSHDRRRHAGDERRRGDRARLRPCGRCCRSS